MTDMKTTETRTFEADVSRLLHMMVHSVYSDRDVFLRALGKMLVITSSLREHLPECVFALLVVAHIFS